MACSGSLSSKGGVFGSARLHPYAQQLPIEPPRNIAQPKPRRQSAHPVLGYHDRSSESKSPSPRRRRQRRSEFSALNVDGMYDDDVNDMSDVPMQSIEPTSCSETGHTNGHNDGDQDTPYPYSPPSDIMPNISERSFDDGCKSALAQRQPSDFKLPQPFNYTRYDDISCEQRRCLDRGPVKFLNVAEIGCPRTLAQVQALLHPRACIDSDANIVDRFVTDCGKGSGRVYDRLLRRELARVAPYAGSSFRRPMSGQVFDIYTGVVRKRCMFDDLRDCNAREDGVLDIISVEKNLDYNPIPDHWSLGGAEAG